ncbi:MAG TPA: XdhC family protein [Deltaproteobacteria bacterium]|nr:XdhC family protein [Deltaproteobacteria bacterium]
MKYLPDFYKHLQRMIESRTHSAIACVISRTGSGPREAGAMMLLTEDGFTAGTVGGGLLEAQVMDLAQTVIQSGKPVCKTFNLDADAAADDGMICGGTVAVLINRIYPSEATTVALYEKLLNHLKQRNTVHLIISIQEHSGGIRTGLGLFSIDGADPGTLPVSAEEVESLSNETGNHFPLLTRLRKERFFILPINLPEVVFIFGAGHISQVLTPFCRTVGFYPVVLDDREDFANPKLFPEAGEIIVIDSFSGCFGGIEVDENSFLVVVTRGHSHDREVVSQALRTPAKYIGMIGSRRKRDGIYMTLRKEGFSEDVLKRIYSPIGLNIGAQTPAEIAVSIVAELIAVRHGHCKGNIQP